MKSVKLNFLPWFRTQRSHILFLVAVLVSPIFFTGCGNGTNNNVAPLPSMTREEILASFIFVDQNGKRRAPRISEFGNKSPIAALLILPRNGKGGQCTASHVVPGVLMTNAHCVDQVEASDLFVVYYNNKTGRQVHTPVTEIAYTGSRESNDAALVTISSSAASEFDTITNLEDFSKQIRNWPAIGSHPPDREQVTIYSLDPLSAHGYEKNPGVMYAPKECTASRTIPKVAKSGPSGRYGETELNPENVKKLDPKMHLVMDECFPSPISGNSGSLVSSKNIVAGELKPRSAGTFHWNLAKAYFNGERTKYQEYFGNNERWMNFLGEDGEETAVAVGTALDYLMGDRSFRERLTK